MNVQTKNDPVETLKKETAKYQKDLWKQRIMVGLGPMGSALKFGGMAIGGVAAGLGLISLGPWIAAHASTWSAGLGAWGAVTKPALVSLGLLSSGAGAVIGAVSSVGGIFAAGSAMAESFDDQLRSLILLKRDWQLRRSALLRATEVQKPKVRVPQAKVTVSNYTKANGSSKSLGRSMN